MKRFGTPTVAAFGIVLVLSACGSARPRGPLTPREWFREGRGRTVVMLGGGVYGAAMFAPHAAELAGEFDVVRVQTLNVQRALDRQPLPADWSISAEAEALAETLTSIGVDGPVDLVGSSLGAVVALHFATRFPDRVRTITLFEPPAFWILTAEDFASDPALSEMWQLTNAMTPAVAPSDEHFVRFRCLLGSCPAAIPGKRDPARADWDRMRYAMRGLAAVPAHREDLSQLARLPHPVLLLRGSDSVSFHQRMNELLARVIPHVTAGELPGGHTAPRSAQAEFLQQLRAFLARHTATASGSVVSHSPFDRRSN